MKDCNRECGRTHEINPEAESKPSIISINFQPQILEQRVFLATHDSHSFEQQSQKGSFVSPQPIKAEPPFPLPTLFFSQIHDYYGLSQGKRSSLLTAVNGWCSVPMALGTGFWSGGSIITVYDSNWPVVIRSQRFESLVLCRGRRWLEEEIWQGFSNVGTVCNLCIALLEDWLNEIWKFWINCKIFGIPPAVSFFTVWFWNFRKYTALLCREILWCNFSF